jgi:GNAT superfamily N-acetyltransferase
LILDEARRPATTRAFEIDHAAVRDLLDFLPALYPGGREWLEGRLADIFVGRAVAVTMNVDDSLAGIAIGILKDSGRFKICTLFVRPEHRRTGVGAGLLDALLSTPESTSSSAVYITAAHTIRREIAPLLSSRGFTMIASVEDRYGAGRHEDVFAR